MKIGQVARKYNISKDNLYYYINYGLLVPPKPNTQYDFDEATLRDLELILKLKDTDYSLQEIHKIISLYRVSGASNPEDRAELKQIYLNKRAECLDKMRHYEEIIENLDRKIVELSAAEDTENTSTGVPLKFFDLLCCPLCGEKLTVSDVNMDLDYIYDGLLSCACGYSAVIDDGILITPNGYNGEADEPDIERELYKDLPPSLISLFQKAYNNMEEDLAKIDLNDSVVMETYINAWFFLHNHQRLFSPNGRYIIVDKFPETLRMYKKLIERENYGLPILYLADSSTSYPIKKKSIDLHIDFFACNEHNFYRGSFLLEELKPYFKSNAQALGTYFSFHPGKRSMDKLFREYPDSSPDNFSLFRFEQQLANSRFRLLHEKHCGSTTESGNNLGFSFHVSGDEMRLTTYLADII